MLHRRAKEAPRANSSMHLQARAPHCARDPTPASVRKHPCKKARVRQTLPKIATATIRQLPDTPLLLSMPQKSLLRKDSTPDNDSAENLAMPSPSCAVRRRAATENSLRGCRRENLSAKEKSNRPCSLHKSQRRAKKNADRHSDQ